MGDLLIFLLIGVIVMILGFFLNKKEKKLFEHAIYTRATVLDYDQYRNHSMRGYGITLYTMNVEYGLPDGTLIRAKEQSGKSRKKYKVGAVIDIKYAPGNPDFFVVKGDQSRNVIFYGMMIVGALLVILALWAMANQ